MSTELIGRMTALQVEQAHAAYTQLAVIYEAVCDGPMNARQFREYYGIMDSRERLRRRFLSLNNPQTTPKQP